VPVLEKRGVMRDLLIEAQSKRTSLPQEAVSRRDAASPEALFNFIGKMAAI
jgi:hypothetical protein